MKKRTRRYFPMDFYGDHLGWRFIIRAYDSNEVLAAMEWRALISIHRKKFNLFGIAIETFPYTLNDLSLESPNQSYSSIVKMLGPVVEVARLNQLYSRGFDFEFSISS